MMTQKCSPLLSPNLIDQIFSDSWLYSVNSFFIIEPQTGSYDERLLNDKTMVEQAQLIKAQFLLGSTIIVKNIESFTTELKRKCEVLGKGSMVDAHMYLNKFKESLSFDFHTDETDVIIHLAYGFKKIEIIKDDIVSTHTLAAGDELFIPKGLKHRAINLAPSCSFSFGIKEDSFFIPGGITKDDFF